MGEQSTSKQKKPLWDDCARPSCDDMINMMKQAHKRIDENDRADHGASASKSADKLRPQKISIATKKGQLTTRTACPPISIELGRASWTLLHTMAAWYPDKPSQADERHMKHFMSALARFYPCPWCAQDFAEKLQEKPVLASSRQDLCQWLCDQHNMVNAKLGKPSFPCDLQSLDERWRLSSKKECRAPEHGDSL